MVRRGAYPPINFGGTRMREYLLTPSGEKRVQALLSDIEPGGGSGDEAYSLPADVEFVFILAGQLHLVVAGEPVTLEAGRRLHVPGQHGAHVPGAAGGGPGPGAVGVLAGAAGHGPVARTAGDGLALREPG